MATDQELQETLFSLSAALTAGNVEGIKHQTDIFICQSDKQNLSHGAIFSTVVDEVERAQGPLAALHFVSRPLDAETPLTALAAQTENKWSQLVDRIIEENPSEALNVLKNQYTSTGNNTRLENLTAERLVVLAPEHFPVAPREAFLAADILFRTLPEESDWRDNVVDLFDRLTEGYAKIDPLDGLRCLLENDINEYTEGPEEEEQYVRNIKLLAQAAADKDAGATLNLFFSKAENYRNLCTDAEKPFSQAFGYAADLAFYREDPEGTLETLANVIEANENDTLIHICAKQKLAELAPIYAQIDAGRTFDLLADRLGDLSIDEEGEEGGPGNQIARQIVALADTPSTYGYLENFNVIGRIYEGSNHEPTELLAAYKLIDLADRAFPHDPMAVLERLDNLLETYEGSETFDLSRLTRKMDELTDRAFEKEPEKTLNFVTDVFITASHDEDREKWSASRIMAFADRSFEKDPSNALAAVAMAAVHMKGELQTEAEERVNLWIDEAFKKGPEEGFELLAKATFIGTTDPTQSLLANKLLDRAEALAPQEPELASKAVRAIPENVTEDDVDLLARKEAFLCHSASEEGSSCLQEKKIAPAAPEPAPKLPTPKPPAKRMSVEEFLAKHTPVQALGSA